MRPVFAHGRLRLYLLKLLDEAPRHGYEVIRLLEERFQGLYAPSAGTVYPRLAKLAAEGRVTHTTEGGRKVYSLTDAGRAELAARQGELADLEVEIHESLVALAAGVREDVGGSAGDLRREVRETAREEVQRIARQVQEQVQSRVQQGDWPGAVRLGMSELARHMGDLGRIAGHTTPRPPYLRPDAAGAPPPKWAEEEPVSPSGDPRRDLERLLDRFRDDVRDAARDHGVGEEQLREARRQLSAAADRLVALLRSRGPAA